MIRVKYYIYTTVISVFLLIGSVFSQNLLLEVNTTSLDINDTLSVTVTVEGGGGGRVELDGLASFDVVSQSQAQNIQVINGETTQSTQLQLQLRAKEPGNFIVGPARVGTQESESIDLTITGEKLFVNGSPQGRAVQQDLESYNSSQVQKSKNSINTLSEEEKSRQKKRNRTMAWILIGLGVISMAIRRFIALAITNSGSRNSYKYGKKQEDESFNPSFSDSHEKKKTLPDIASDSFYEEAYERLVQYCEKISGMQSKSFTPHELIEFVREHESLDDTILVPILEELESTMYRGKSPKDSRKNILLDALQNLPGQKM